MRPNASGVWMADLLMAGDFFERTVDTFQCPPAEAVPTDVDYDRCRRLMSTKSLFDAYGKPWYS
jgi:hypothetical protein